MRVTGLERPQNGHHGYEGRDDPWGLVVKLETGVTEYVTAVLVLLSWTEDPMKGVF